MALGVVEARVLLVGELVVEGRGGAAGAVEESAEGLGLPVEDPGGLVGLGTGAPAGAEVRGAERVLGDEQSGPAAEGRVTRESSLRKGAWKAVVPWWRG
ncbi:hypothetical protein C5F59_032260 [Streptomyces sp. QL37]|uniref:hypothetical protein n=1 Tax=Streptomyces sp. QL37 TaxID=2093747 RepID=UPI000CF26292|nr:hypothetical protein [Streptomyces sp. QL37]PPQ60914.1 hypothetical protein C5F59_32750 [Streptomyces sp. QL37]